MVVKGFDSYLKSLGSQLFDSVSPLLFLSLLSGVEEECVREEHIWILLSPAMSFSRFLACGETSFMCLASDILTSAN